MNITASLQFKMKSERDAGLALDKALAGVANGSKSTLADVKAGVERASWYSSCLFDKYSDVCNELKTEDKRFFLGVKEIYKRKDVILFMLELYIRYELSLLNDDEYKNSLSPIQRLDRKVTQGLANYATVNLTRQALSRSIALSIYSSHGFQSQTITVINRTSLVVVTAFSLYGKIQKASSISRDLNLKNPEFYWLLHSNNLEMLYFLIEPAISNAIDSAKNKKGSERIVQIIKYLTK
jgi:hypothetical protein